MKHTRPRTGLGVEKIFRSLGIIAVTFLFFSCGDKRFLEDALYVAPDSPPDTSTPSPYFESGDIVVLSGGSVSLTTSPYPLHQIVQFSATGVFKRILYQATSGGMLGGMDFNAAFTKLFFTVDSIDRVEKIDLSNLANSNEIIDANLSGATLRSVTELSDGSLLVVESSTSIEKYDSNRSRVSAASSPANANFPIVTLTGLNNVRKVSGGRFAVLNSQATDNPRIYTNAGVLSTTLSGPACGTNCDPYDMLELSDGRFVVSNQATHALELYSSSFAYVGQLFLDTSALQTPTGLAQMANGHIVVCSSAYNTCEELAISGNTATRVGTRALIDEASLIRQPLSVRVMP